MANRKEVIEKLFEDLKTTQETRKLIAKVTNPGVDECYYYRSLVDLEETIATELTHLLNQEEN